MAEGVVVALEAVEVEQYEDERALQGGPPDPLVEVARDCGTEAHLIDNAGEVEEEWLDGVRVVGVSSGASAPENLVGELVEFFRRRGVSDVSEFDVVKEDVRFMLPKQIREAVAAEVSEAAAAGAATGAS